MLPKRAAESSQPRVAQASEDHEKRSGWTALVMGVSIFAVPVGLAFAGRLSPSPAQRLAQYEARRAEQLGARSGDEERPLSASETLARAAGVAARSRRAPEERAVALRNAAWQMWSEIERVGNSREKAEASFRAAELHRSVGQVSEALQGFLEACRVDPRGPLAARALLAASSLMRHEGHWDGALTLLNEIALEHVPPPGELRSEGRVSRTSKMRDRARYERARTLQQAGRLEAARMAFRELAEECEHPLLAVSRYDGWSRVLVLEGDLEGAAGVLEAAREKFRRRSFERTETGNQLRRALQNMICIPRLERAVARRHAQHSTVFERAHEAKDALRDTVRGDF